MENRRKNSSSGETFSFPSTPSNQEDQDSDFEFGCLTPDSPSQDPNRDSPADHLFFNGRLLPHAFPLQQQQQPSNYSCATTSRTSSISSKDSLVSSRSNSTNSRSSNSSSPRTSSSDNSERRSMKMLMNHQSYRVNSTMASKLVNSQSYASSQRWQYITPVPASALKRNVSKRSRNTNMVGSKKKLQGEKIIRAKPGGSWCRRFIRSLLLACKECHAMEPSRKDDVMQGKSL